ncbi:Conserved protein YcjX with nucleoside triphosphate hydrolase domain [Pseudoalteromonas luteoviolacea B = ATCC 29581]|nr:Conserved protein YcjX with nucleoside triphosphate hydrolase domain [Pseudoalteromonas luteoviolacea B = ATCC 29581]
MSNKLPISIKTILNEAEKVVQRGFDKHVKIAVTGFSGSGKTAFITALVRQLTAQVNKDNLPFFDVVHSGRFIACKQTTQEAMSVPTFDYRRAVSCLLDAEPSWPPATSRINMLTLALKYYAKQGLRAHLAPESTLYIELYDYPGEWLVDLPLLDMDYAGWSLQQLEKYQSPLYSTYAAAFLEELASLDVCAPADDLICAKIAKIHAELLKALKANTPATVLQPGRQLLPGELLDAPVLGFFPCHKPENEQENSVYRQLVERFEAYKETVVKPFYKNYFCEFDRQVVLVDIFASLQGGPAYMTELQEATQAMLALFEYGKSNWLSRLLKPKIDKVLFAANKCDSVSSTQHSNIVRLLDSLLQESHNTLRFDHVKIDTMAMSSVKSSIDRKVQEHGSTLDCVYGKPTNESNWITYLPSQVPTSIEASAIWPRHGYEFTSFSPLPAQQGQIGHIRMDHALQFLLGDKLR